MLLFYPEQIKLIFEEAKKCYPLECCGFLLGEESRPGERLVKRVLPVSNAAQDPKVHFEVEAQDLIRAEILAENSSCQIIGVYHTHTDCSAKASEEDAAYALPNMSYPIVSVVDGTVEGMESWEKRDPNNHKCLDREIMKLI
jgi:proteasome lid subunit RPN8/RPN11